MLSETEFEVEAVKSLKLAEEVQSLRKDKNKLDFLLRVLRVTAETDMYDELYWAFDTMAGPFFIGIKCSDEFYWGCADDEELTPDNIAVLEQAIVDCRQVTKYGNIYAPQLFCCRMRKMRPQGCAYPSELEMWPLIDACGPERPVGLGNPYRPGEYQEKARNAQQELREERNALKVKVAELEVLVRNLSECGRQP